MLWVALYALTGIVVGQSLEDNEFPRPFVAPAWGLFWAVAWPALWLSGRPNGSG